MLIRILDKHKNQVYDFIKTIYNFQLAGINPNRSYPWFYLSHENKKIGVVVCRIDNTVFGKTGYLQTVIHQDFRGQGLLKLTLDLFDNFVKLDCLLSLIHKNNDRACKARLRTGFVFINQWRDLLRFTMTREQFKQIRRV